MKRILFLSIILMFGSSPDMFLLAAGSPSGPEPPLASGGIRGRVIDVESQQALSGATIIVEREGSIVTGAIADKRGDFNIPRVEEGHVRLRVRYLGYETHQQDIIISANETLTLQIALQASPHYHRPVEILGDSPEVYRELTGAAQKIDRKNLEAIRPVGTQEILEYVPGVHGFGDDGIGNSRISIGIRGLNPRRSSRVLFLEDGIPIQPAMYVYPNMYYNPPVERLDALEIIKGSASILHGPQTMGGVINYVTRRPRSELGGFTKLSIGTNGYASIFSELGGWGSKTLRPEIQLLYKRGDGFRDNNSFDQVNATLKLNVTPDESSMLYVKANVNYENSQATYTGLTEYSFRTDPTFNPKEDDNFKVFRTSLDLIYTNQVSDRAIATTKGYFAYFDRRWWREYDVFVKAGNFDGQTVEPVPYFEVGDLIRVGNDTDNFGILRTFYSLGVEHSYDFNHDVFSAEANLDFGGRLHFERFIDDRQQGNAVDARSGVYFVKEMDDTTEVVTILGQSHHYETMALSLFAQERLAFGDLTLRFGARLELFEQERIDRLNGARYQDKSSIAFLPGLGLNYQIGEFNLYGGVHRGYTPPSSGTLKVVNFGEDSDDGGLDLKSEKSWNVELGARGAGKFFAFELTGFFLTIEDMVAAARGTAFKNLGRVENYGLEAGGTLALSRLQDFVPDLHFSYTYLQSEVKEGTIESAVIAGADVNIAGNELPYAPRHALTLGLGYSFDFGLSLRCDLRHQTRSFSDFENILRTNNRGDTGPIPAYSILNATAAWKIDDTWQLGLAVKNVADEIYIASRLHSSPRQPEASASSGILVGSRRQATLSVNYHY